jgi:hypothetical protein
MEQKHAARWHLRLVLHFGVDADTFAQMLKHFILDPSPVVNDILKTLCTLSSHRGLYDRLIPYLVEAGEMVVARRWHSFLAARNDLPTTLAARSFLRHVDGYFPESRIDPTESGFAKAVLPTQLQPLPAFGQVPLGAPEQGEQSHDLRHAVNRAYGTVFGITEKTYNDTLGAKWFATKWVPLDIAVEFVRVLGVTEIGPLSLQSIAIRERQPGPLLQRIEQLKGMGISVGSSNYARAIQSFVLANDEESLVELLYSDMHPDVFDDARIQEDIMHMAHLTGNWSRARLVSAVQLAASQDAVTVLSNQMLQGHLRNYHHKEVLLTLDEMRARGVELSPSSAKDISTFICRSTRPFGWNLSSAEFGFLISLCQRAMAMGFPPATMAFRRILLRLGLQGKFGDLERLSMDILQYYYYYSRQQNLERPTAHVHNVDLPLSLQEVSSGRIYHKLPAGLSLNMPHHPIHKIFFKGFQMRLVRWTFRRAFFRRGNKPYAKEPLLPAHFGWARGIRLLALLRERGVHVDTLVVRKAIVLRLTEMFWDGLAARSRQASKAKALNRMKLEEAKALCDEAWGSYLLPPVGELKAMIESFAARTVHKQKQNMERIAARNKRHGSRFQGTRFGKRSC